MPEEKEQKSKPIYKTIKTIGEIEKNKYSKLLVSISRMSAEDRVIHFVAVQDLVQNKERDRYEYTKKGYTINVEKWDGFMKLMNAVTEYINKPQEEQEEPVESQEVSKPNFMEE